MKNMKVTLGFTSFHWIGGGDDPRLRPGAPICLLQHFVGFARLEAWIGRFQGV